MLQEKDYIMKAIMQLTKAVAELIFKREHKQYEEALTLANAAFERVVGLSSKIVNSISTKDLLGLLKTNGLPDADKIVSAAFLLKEEAQIYEDQKDYDKSYERELKALNLLLEVYINDYKTNVPDYAVLMRKLIEKLETYQLPNETKTGLLLYQEKEGRYAKAEDLLYELLEETNNDSDTVVSGIKFYERLLNCSDEGLSAGNLSKEEVKDGLERLSKIREHQSC